MVVVNGRVRHHTPRRAHARTSTYMGAYMGRPPCVVCVCMAGMPRFAHSGREKTTPPPLPKQLNKGNERFAGCTALLCLMRGADARAGNAPQRGADCHSAACIRSCFRSSSAAASKQLRSSSAAAPQQLRSSSAAAPQLLRSRSVLPPQSFRVTSAVVHRVASCLIALDYG